MNRRRERDFDHHPDAVGAARRFVGEVLAAWGLDNDGRAELATSELATNAVRHAGTRFTVRIADLDTLVRVEVGNGSPLLPTVGDLPAQGESARGIAIVQAITASWGVTPSSKGKTVWFTVPVVLLAP